jgi:hypothetical protein
MPNEKLTKVPFSDVFKDNMNGDLILQKKLIIGDETFEPEHVIKRGQLLNGVDLHKRKGLPLSVLITPSGTYILKGFFIKTD